MHSPSSISLLRLVSDDCQALVYLVSSQSVLKHPKEVDKQD